VDSTKDPVLPPERVAEVLQQLRSGVRQRTAELAVQGEATEEARQGLAAVRAREYVEEPVPLSHRRRLGRPIVLARKLAFHLFFKWYMRPLLEQQNAFNQAAGRVLQDILEAEERLRREVRLLVGRVADLERRLGAEPPPGAPPANDRE
jgi:hypothetical protein